MKVDTQPLVFAGLIAHEKPVKKDEFDAFLGEYVPSDNEYYWQHQHQLQQSELTFKSDVQACAAQPTTADTEKVIDPAGVTNHPAELPHHTNDVAQSQHFYIPRLDRGIQGSQAGGRSLDPAVKPRDVGMVPQDVVRVPRDVETLELQTRYKPLINIASPTNFKNHQLNFKNHQLFIDNNQVELALNTHQLSKQHITELQKFVQQWLSQKGYALKQLMINGVQQ